MNGEYQICNRCIMDTTDPEITFNSNGICNHCQRFDLIASPILEQANNGSGKKILDNIIIKIKEEQKKAHYDCILGISGGVDSTYVAYLVKELGLRPLAVHFDSGWNSELAVNNIENLVKKLNIDLYTYVVDWKEMQDLQLAFFKASVANCDIPTDHAFPAVLYKLAAKHNIKYIISGSNLATEFILPTAWGYDSADLRHIKSIHKKFGEVKLKKYPTLNFFQQFFYYPFIKKIKILRILNCITYNKEAVKELIQEKLNWRDYGGKHYESIFTRFFQSYYLTAKFGFDKRRAHLSSLILSGQLSREEAIKQIRMPSYDEAEIVTEKHFIAKKLGITDFEFDSILSMPKKTYKDYSSNEYLFKLKAWILSHMSSLRTVIQR